MHSTEDPSCCFIASSRDHPLRLFDSNTSEVRATYTTKNQVDEIQAPLSASFNLDGSKIYCGFEGSLMVFDTLRPGSDYFDLIKLTPMRKSKEGTKGLVSTIAFNPDYSGLYAIGTFSGQIGIYDERTNGLLLPLKSPHKPGVSQVKFSFDGRMLFSASRCSEGIQMWDIRNTAQVIHTFSRESTTNQRIYFDTNGSKLVTGTQYGKLNIFCTNNLDRFDELLIDTECVAGVSVNSVNCEMIATCAGERQFVISDSSDDDCNDGSSVEKRRSQYRLCIWKI